MHTFIRKFILTVIDGFYPPFKKLMPLQTFRYAACGGATTSLDIFIFFISYNFIVHKQLVHLGFITISPHIFSFMIAFCFSFPTGFYLNRYVVWQQTQTKKRVQFFRYFIVVMVCVLLNYFFLHLFVDQLGWWPTVAKIVTSVIVIAFSYFTQRHYSFKATD
ncbi:MAG: GtrA family protein [Parafilimonas sp.]